MKDFDPWNKKKREIEGRDKTPHFHQREVWWCSLGVNIGQEQDGKGGLYERPVLIFKKLNSQIFLGIPATSSYKNVYTIFAAGEDLKEFYFIVTQIRLISVKRLNRYMSKLTDDEFYKIRSAIFDVIDDSGREYYLRIVLNALLDCYSATQNPL